MGDRFELLSDKHQRFIEEQKIFFVGTAAREGRINVSPKGGDCLRVLSPGEILWLNLTGSGNETAAHLLDTNRITLMWCAFEGPPRILRAYGRAEAIYPDDDRWAEYSTRLPAPLGARQYMLVSIELVQQSCGYAVPFFDYREDREVLAQWSAKKGEEGIRDYWAERNSVSLDGKPTRKS